MLTTAKKLRNLLEEKETIYTVGVGDALSARIASQTEGIDGILSSGFAISTQQFGLPDVEYYTRTENVAAVRNMTYVADIPLIADIDTAYGNAVSAIKTIHEFEQAGAAGVIIEDQISPKRCPICVDELNNLISAEEAAGKIKAMKENRKDENTVIIARSDATDFDELLRRCKLYSEAGADLVQPISKAFSSKDEVKRFVEEVDSPVSLIIVGWLEELTAEDIKEIGPKIAHFALVSVTAAHAAIANSFEEIGKSKTPSLVKTPRISHNEMLAVLGMEQVSIQEQKYLPSEVTK